MYPSTALHHPDHPSRELSDTLPVCVFYSDGEKLYAFEASWNNLFDFIKAEKRGQFEVKFDASSDFWQSANSQPWGIRFREAVTFRFVMNAEGNITIMLKKGRWKNEYRLFSNRSRLISHKWDSKRHLIIQQPWCSFKG
jgi:hypothetical protein